MKYFVEFCDEKFFTNVKKCSIINLVLNLIHESVFIKENFFEKINPKLKFKYKRLVKYMNDYLY